MTDSVVGPNPAGFQPVPPSPAPLERLVWVFSAAGRARLKLRRAYRTPADRRATESVVNALQKLRSSTPLGEDAESVVKDILVFLVWSSLRQNATEQAGRWITTFDKQLPNAPERAALRWDLMRRLLSEQQFDGFLAQARLFLTDPAVEHDQSEIPLGVARILAGAPEPPDRNDQEFLAALESAMLLLLTSEYDVDAASVRGRLSEGQSDRICEEFPALRSAAEVLGFALDAIFELQSGQGLRVPRVRSLPWMNWMLVRAYLKAAGAAIAVGPERAPFLTTAPATQLDVATAWAVESWWSMYGPPGVDTPALVQACAGRLDAAAGEASVQAATAISSIRQIRARHSEAQPLDPASFDCLTSVWRSGDLCESVMLSELRFEAALLNLRLAGEPSNARSTGEDSARAYSELAEQIDGMPRISSAWFRPAVAYRRAAALAQAEPDGARAILQNLLRGPKAVEARAQLALLDIQAGALDAAEQLLRDMRPLFPSVLYAQALLQVRRGNADSARQLLASFGVAFPSTETPYRLAVKRLEAALEERAGNADEAERLHREILAASPSDATTAARLGRLILKKTYGSPPDEAANQELALLLQTAAAGPCQQVDWSRGHDLLRRLLVCPEDDLAGMRDDVMSTAAPPGGRSALLQVAARRLLQAKRTDDARKLIEIEERATEYETHHRTRLVLRAWRHLSDVWLPFQAPGQDAIEAEARRIRSGGKRAGTEADDLAAAEAALRAKAVAASISHEALREMANCAEEMDKLRSDDADEVARRWCFLLSQAIAFEGGSGAEAQANQWQELRPWPLASLPDLWTSDAAARAQAADELHAAVETGDLNWDDQQRLLLSALASWAAGREEEYLDAYTLLEPVLDRLPVDGQSMWLQAGSIWFRRGNWRQLLESDLPECVADLSNPQVRLLIGFAYARAAADDGQKDPLKALQRVRQARGTMEPLLTTAGERG